MASANPPPAGAPAPAPSPAPTAAKAGAPAPSPAPAAAASGSTETKTTTTKKKTTKKKSSTGDGDGTKKKKTVRKKKQSTKSSGTAASNAAMLAAAKSSTADLAHSKALSAARRTDPLWYRIEDVLSPATTGKGADHHHDHSMASAVLPEQIHIIEAALAHNNMSRSDVTPQAMACLLEQARRYAQELLEDAQDYAAHAGGMFAPNPSAGKTGAGAAPTTVATTPSGMPDPAPKDYLLAAEMRPDHPQAVTAQLPKLNLLAQQVNSTPLPAIPPQCYSGILLPSAPHALTARTFDVVSGAHVAAKMIQAAPSQTKAFAGSMMTASAELAKASSSSSSKTKSSKTGYGASRGAQIAIKLKKEESATTAAAAAADSTSSSTTPKPSSGTTTSSAPGPSPSKKEQ